jgi:hypothetical protein
MCPPCASLDQSLEDCYLLGHGTGGNVDGLLKVKMGMAVAFVHREVHLGLSSMLE